MQLHKLFLMVEKELPWFRQGCSTIGILRNEVDLKKFLYFLFS